MNLILPSLKIGLEYDEDDEFKVYTFNDPIETLSNYKTGHYNFYFLMLKCQISIALNYIERNKKERYNKVKICFLTAFEHYYYDEFKKYSLN
jgi:hypothetical protein